MIGGAAITLRNLRTTAGAALFVLSATLALSVLHSSPASAACVQSGTTVDCTGNLSGPPQERIVAFDLSDGVNKLNVYSLTRTSISLTGHDANSGFYGRTSHYECSIEGQCAIVPGAGIALDTCTANAGATCVDVPANPAISAHGPSGKAAATMTSYVDAGGQVVTGASPWSRKAIRARRVRAAPFTAAAAATTAPTAAWRC